MESLVKFVQDEFVTKKEIPNFKSGDTITVFYEIREGEKVRTQFFKGVVIQIKGTGLTKTFTIRKMSGTIGIERIFPINLPTIQKIEINKKSNWKKISLKENDLQGKWLMVGRIRDGKEQRRNLDRPRKTMKILINGYFQWIAFNTETFQFSGSGGGKYSTKNGIYSEKIEYFSRDNSRVGAKLKFDYKLKNEVWNHIGFSSKGDPMHELWIKRK